jgi:hypothetical protein
MIRQYLLPLRVSPQLPRLCLLLRSLQRRILQFQQKIRRFQQKIRQFLLCRHRDSCLLLPG